MAKSTRTLRNRKPPSGEEEKETVAVDVVGDAEDEEERSLGSDFDGLMSGLSGSLRDKVGEVLKKDAASTSLDKDISLSSKGPLGNLDYIEPGSLQHLLLLGFDESGNYLSDLNHLSENQAEQFVATRLRWWYAARSDSKGGDLFLPGAPFPAGCPMAWSPSVDPDVEEVTS